MTGIMDSPLTNGKDTNLKERLEGLKHLAVSVNANLANELDIQASAAITCVKPSGRKI